MKNCAISIIVIVVSSILSACQPAKPSPDDGWEKHEHQSLGVTYEIDESWIPHEENGVINIKIGQETYDNQANTEAGASITLARIEDFDGIGNPSEILKLFMEYLEYDRTDLNRLGNPEVTTIQDLSAASIAYQGSIREQSGDFTAVVITNGEYLGLIFTFDSSDDGQYQDDLLRFTQSISIYPPSMVQP